MALTATATRRVADDIVAQLRLRDPRVVRASSNRAEIFYEVVLSDTLGDGQTALSHLVHRLRTDERFTQQCGLVYCATREATVTLGARPSTHTALFVPCCVCRCALSLTADAHTSDAPSPPRLARSPPPLAARPWPARAPPRRPTARWAAPSEWRRPPACFAGPRRRCGRCHPHWHHGRRFLDYCWRQRGRMHCPGRCCLAHRALLRVGPARRAAPPPPRAGHSDSPAAPRPPGPWPARAPR